MFWRSFLLLFFSVALAAEPLVLTVENAVERVLSANWQLLSARESLDDAHMQLGLQEGLFDLQWTPLTEAGVNEGGVRLGTGVMLSRRLRCGTAIGCTPRVGRGYKRVALNLWQPLFRGTSPAVNEDPIHAARHGVRASELALRLSQVRVVMETIRALYTVAKWEAILDIEEASAATLARFVQATRLKGRIGIASDMDIYQAEMEWKGVEEARGAAAEQLASARDAVRRLLVIPAEQEFAVEVPIAEMPVTIDVEERVEEALEGRLEIAQAEAKIEEARRKMQVAKHKLLPEVNVTCSYAHNGRESDWAVGLTTGTDWSRKREQVAYRQSTAAAVAAERGLEECRKRVQHEVEQAVRGLYRSEERVRLGEEKLRSSEGKVRLARLRIERGLAKASELVGSEKSFKGAQRDLIEALVDHTVGHYQLMVATGALL